MIPFLYINERFSMKTSLEDVEFALRKAQVDEPKVKEVVDELKAQIEAAKLEKEERAKRAPKKFQILASVKDDAQKVEETPEWIFQTDESFDHNKLEETIQAVIVDFKSSGKKKAEKVNTIGDAILYIPNKFFKARGLVKKTKEPVLVSKTDNTVPNAVAP